MNRRAVVLLGAWALSVGAAAAGTAQSPSPSPGGSLLPSPSLGVAGTWSDGVSLPAGRAETSAAVIDDRIHVPGGLGEVEGGTAPTIDTMVVFDAGTAAWSDAAPMPGPRDHAGVAAWDGKLYVSGGGEFATGRGRANLWVYDVMADAWSELARMPGGRWQHAMVTIDGILYVVGGLISDSVDHTAVWAYDIETGEWRTDPAPLPTAREHLAAVAVNDRVVAIGGRMGENFSTVEIYDPSADTWSAGPDMPTARSGFTVGVMADGIHVTGGEDLEVRRTIGSHEVLDLETMTWSSLPELPESRHGLSSGVVGGAWYVIGGGRLAGLSTTDLVEVWASAS